MAKYIMNIDNQTLTYYHDKVNFFNKNINEIFQNKSSEIKQTDETNNETQRKTSNLLYLDGVC